MAGRDIGGDEAEKRRKEELERREAVAGSGNAKAPARGRGVGLRRQAQEREAQLRAAERAAREAAFYGKLESSAGLRYERGKRKPRAWNKRARAEAAWVAVARRMLAGPTRPPCKLRATTQQPFATRRVERPRAPQKLPSTKSDKGSACDPTPSRAAGEVKRRVDAFLQAKNID